MKFGKLADISNVKFDLPEDHPQTQRVLEAARKEQSTPQIYLGATGWGNREWLGQWYPTGTKQAEFLRPYARQFGTLEFNSTHYRIPTAAQIEKWYHLACDGFYFCPKVPQSISHYERLRGPDTQTQAFTEVIRGLLDRLGPIFMQMPENYAPSQVRFFTDYLQRWPTDLPLYLEFRHPDFFLENEAASFIWNLLERLGHGAVITDVAGRRDVLHMRLPNPNLVLRFVGNAGHPSDHIRAQQWVRRLKSWMDQGLHSAHIFVHQPEMDLVPEYTRYWAKLIAEECGIKVRAPELVPEARQGKLF